MSASPARKRPRLEPEEEVVKQEPHLDTVSPASAGPCPTLPEPRQTQSNLRSEPETHGRGSARHRDAEFWYSDGSIILVAKEVEFRVYAGLLAEHSSVFRAMFEEQHPVRLVPLNGHLTIPCPVIELTDTPEDLRHILRIYVSRKSTKYFDAGKPSYPQTSAYIRLGYKYKLKELYKQSLHLLKRHYTSNLERWTKHDYWRPSHWDTVCYSIGVVNLARLVGEPTLLPTALLACIYMEEDLVRGFEREDGTRETLALEDLGRCFRAMKDIQQAKAASIRRTCTEAVAEACTTKGSCVAALRLARVQHLDAHVSGFRSETGDPFQPIDEADDVELGTCEHCTAMVLERDRTERQLLWGQLPELLGVEVPNWGRPVSQREGS